MSKLLFKASKWVDAFNSGMMVFCGILVLLMMVATSWEVFTRYLFNSPTAWSLELSENLMVAVVFLGAGYCCMIEGHISIDILYSRFCTKNKARADVTASVLGIIFVGVVLWQVYIYFRKLLETGQTSAGAMDWPLWPIMLVCVIGSFLFFIQLLIRLMKAIVAVRQNHNSEENA